MNKILLADDKANLWMMQPLSSLEYGKADEANTIVNPFIPLGLLDTTERMLEDVG